MANLQRGSVIGVAAKGGDNTNGGSAIDIGFTLTNVSPINISSLRTRLAAISGSLYTTAMLNTMSFNDMVYAVRVNDQASSI